MEFKKTFKYIADLILPRICLVCGCRLLYNERYICLYCRADLPLTRFWDTSHNHMSDKFNAVIQKGLEKTWNNEEGLAYFDYERYAYACALFFFSDDAPYRHILYNIKYEGRTDAGHYFGKMLGTRLASSSAFSDVDCVIPVPLHWIRRWKRGYNQAEVIAKEVAYALQAPLERKTLVRCRRTRTQTKLDQEQKVSNVANAFKVKNMPDHKIRHILLIDDVFTTGSTLMACFTALRTVFPPGVRISVTTLGFVGGA